MAVLVICKFDEYSVKNEVPVVRIFNPLYVCGRLKGSNSNLNCSNCSRIVLIQDFMAILITGTPGKESIKNWMLSSWQHFRKSIGPSREGNSHFNSLKWAKIQLVRDFTPALAICKCNEYSKMRSLSSRKYFPIICLWQTKMESNSFVISRIICPSRSMQKMRNDWDQPADCADITGQTYWRTTEDDGRTTVL